MLGSPVDLAKVDTDAYVIAGVADHLCPWQSCYRTTQLLGGPVTFVLSTSGQIASMINSPANPKASFQTAAANPPDPGGFLAAAHMGPAAWWSDYSPWLAAGAGGRKKSPRRCSAPRPDPMSTPAEVRGVAVARQLLRVSVRPALNPAAAGTQPHRPPLLLINGIGASLELLEPFVAKLDPAVEVIRFDPPGVGGSPPPRGPYRFSGLCRLIADMLTELGYDGVDVLGISWGGGVAQHFAAFHRA